MSESDPKTLQTSMEIPGAVSPDEAEGWEPAGGEAAAPQADKRARIAALMRKRGGEGRGGGGKGQLRDRLRARAAAGEGAGAAGGGGGRAMLDRVLTQMKERGGAEGGKRQRLVQVLEAVARDFDAQERQLKTLREQLADAEEKLRVLTEGDDLAGGI